MINVFRNATILLFAILILSACTRTQLPTPGDTASRYGDNNGLIPDNTPGEWGPDELQQRGLNDSYTDGTYKGRPTVMGLFQPVYFNFDSASIAAAERAKLQEAARYLDKNARAGVLLEGHCDWYGTADYNLALGELRANSARDYLSTLGVNSSRIETLSKGSLEATGGLSKAQSAQDRRVEIIILK
ncbi:MAG: OmpA family protein [Opitutales bacterium]